MAAANEPTAPAGAQEPQSPNPGGNVPADPETGIRAETPDPTPPSQGGGKTDSPPCEGGARGGPSQGGVGPAASTGIQEGAPAADQEEVIPLPPLLVKRTPLTPEQLEKEIRLLDRVLVGMVLVLAFLLASFAIQNSDFWMHLATGRLIAQGEYTFGENPFSYPETVYWANHAWLFDVVLYQLANLSGGIDASAAGIVLVVFKALLVTALAVVMLKTRRPGQSLWVPTVCTGLAVLAMSPNLLLQPAVVSFLFLGLTLYLLYRGSRIEGAAPSSILNPRYSIWLLPLLFVLWVNLDGGFLLGLLAVGLYLLGELLQRAF